MLPAYDKQSGILLAHVEAVDEDMLPTAATAPAVDLVVSASGMTPRQSGMHAFITLRRLQQGLWSRPPAAQRASIAANSQWKVNKGTHLHELATFAFDML